jgi:hypothetical protein
MRAAFTLQWWTLFLGYGVAMAFKLRWILAAAVVAAVNVVQKSDCSNGARCVS